VRIAGAPRRGQLFQYLVSLREVSLCGAHHGKREFKCKHTASTLTALLFIRAKGTGFNLVWTGAVILNMGAGRALNMNAKAESLGKDFGPQEIAAFTSSPKIIRSACGIVLAITGMNEAVKELFLKLWVNT